MEIKVQSEKLLEYRDYAPDFRTLLIGLGDVEDIRLYYDNGFCESLAPLLVRMRNRYSLWLTSELIPLLNSLGKPWLFIHGDTDALTRLKLSREEWARIHEHGLNVFFHEPLFLYTERGSWPWTPNKGGEPVYQDLKWLEQFCQQAPFELRPDVFVCELGMAEHLARQKLFTNFKFHEFSTFLLESVALAKQTPWPYVPLETCNKRLISLNFRYDPFRELIAAYLRGKGYHLHSYLTFYHQHQRELMLKKLPFDPRRWALWPVIEEGLQAMQLELPYSLEVKNPKVVDPHIMGIPDFTKDQNLRDHDRIRRFYDKAFASMVCESRPHSPRGEISEKTIRPIQAMRPFLIMGSPRLLEGLRKLGFQTFPHLWDESYDAVESAEERFLSLLHNVDRCFAWSDLELRQLARRTFETVLFNRQHLLLNFEAVLKTRLCSPSVSS